MKKYSKILISLFVFTVLISNISYSLTLSICGMTGGSSCSCEMSRDKDKGKDKDNTETIKKAPCCNEEVKNISNASDFESTSNIKILLSSGIINFSPQFVSNIFFKISDTPLRFIFYNKSTDLPVRYSSLLI